MSVNTNKSKIDKVEKSFNEQKHNNKSYNENSFNTTVNNYTNFELDDLEVNMFKESKPFCVIGESIL